VARIVVEAGDTCPALRADGRSLATERREPVPEGFQPACEAVIPAKTKSLEFSGHKLKLPRTPDLVVVFGDTGCRVTKRELQACNDPMAWPFLHNAQTIAKARPDLIVHVGDYLYREDACPDDAKGCAGPHGDNWPTWKADFFDPAGTALAAAPWVFTRGNHESCARSWRGWFYYLDPRPFDGKCAEQSDEWIARSGKLRIGVMDSALVANQDSADEKYVPRVTEQLGRLSGHVDWISVHHPFWAYEPGETPTVPLAAAWDKSRPEGVRMVVSGHIHLFEFLGFATGHPSQLVAGMGGTNLEMVAIQQRLAGQTVFGAPVNSGESRHEFGHTELRRVRNGAAKGWTLALMELDGSKALSCRLPEKGDARCAQ
jgi:predicted phosphodiesterase